jgi:hypothetical protein
MPLFFGDPAVRISALVNAVTAHEETSICDTDYTSAVEKVGELIGGKLDGCLDSYIVQRADGTGPDCTAYDETPSASGQPNHNAIPSCTANGGIAPCWQVQMKPMCPPVVNPQDGQAEQIGISVNRGGAAAPAGAETHIFCATIAHAS